MQPILPVRWQALTERGIRIHHRSHDDNPLGPWIWVRLPDGKLAGIPWIHREHAHHPFNDRTWQYLRTTASAADG
ncbi:MULTISPECIES: hypothetical protein [unclassified Streptomyces]|uniref:hypothetical protein n=1 Tax=unclassified Streptomyces TaxID=2593676 RepID=UPI0038177136